MSQTDATQAADQTEDASEFDREHAYLSSAIDDADAARDPAASKSEPTAPRTTNTTTATEEEHQHGEPAKEEKKGGGGGFLGAIGLGGSKKKNKDDKKETAAGAEQAEEDKAEAEKHLPPNHLGSTVPEGASRDLADPGTVAPGQTDGLAQQKSGGGAAATTTSTSDETTPRSPSTSVGKQPDRGGSMASAGGVSPERVRSVGAGGGAQLAGSRGEHRGSMIPADAPKYKRVENPDRIPIAGGKRIGEEQYQTRRASVAPSTSPPRDMAKLDREGSPDPVTAANTEANIDPASTSGGAPAVEGKNTAPQQMKEFSMGDASKDAETKPAGSGPAEEVAPDEGRPVENATAAPVAASGKENAAAGGGHARRGSVFDRLKEKVKGHKK